MPSFYMGGLSMKGLGPLHHNDLRGIATDETPIPSLIEASENRLRLLLGNGPRRMGGKYLTLAIYYLEHFVPLSFYAPTLAGGSDNWIVESRIEEQSVRHFRVS